MLTRRCTVSSRTASTAAASIKCARILRSCAVCRTCFFRGAVRFAGHCWGRTHCRARFARPACPRKCAYSTFRRVCRRANTIFTPLWRLPRRRSCPRAGKSPLRQNHKKTEAVCPEIMGVLLRSFHSLYELIQGISAPSGMPCLPRPTPAMPKIG